MEKKPKEKEKEPKEKKPKEKEAQEKLGRLAEMENEYKRENRKCKKLLAARLLQDETLAAADGSQTRRLVEEALSQACRPAGPVGQRKQ